jgi:single-stranded-DNA-specific exonuclease
MYSVRPDISPEGKAELAHLPEIVAKLLYYRGVVSAADAKKFIEPSYDEHTHDPFLLKDMDRAVDRIFKAIDSGERIIIFTDYDHDGVPAGVILSDLLDKLNYSNYRVYIPHRHNEGFGLNRTAIEEFVSEGAKLLITADCGIADYDEVAFAEANGINVIVTDHHVVTHGLPPAYAVIDPKREDCKYPEKFLCGAGVAFKLVQGVLARDRRGIIDGWEKWLLDMVGIATLSDMVPLKGENRVFAHFGLVVLRRSPRVGLQKLFRKLRIDQRKATEEDVGFGISPRINAASRMGVPYDAFRLLKTKDEAEAGAVADHLESINKERKTYVATISKKAKKMIQEKYVDGKPIAVVIGDPEWRPALLGLVANKITEEWKCPAFVWGREGQNIIKGSCRSYGDINLQDIMAKLSKDMVIEYGGHALAGGFSVSQDSIHGFPGAIESAVKAVSQVSTVVLKNIDHTLDLDRINHKLFTEIRSLSPFGEDNANPVFLFPNVELASVRFFGKGEEHIELIVSQNKKRIKAIQFFCDKERFAELKRDGVLNLVAHIEQDMFAGGALRLRIKDFFI